MPEPEKRVSLKWLNWLEKEAAAWARDGIIDEGQAGAIIKRYEGVREREEHEKGGRLVTVLAVIGALLLGIGVILFFAANWQELPKWFKVTLILGSTVLAYVIGYLLAFETERYPRVGRALILLGSLLYGSGIWLIAQIFHISAHFPNGFLLWVIGIIPVVLICRSMPVLIETSLLLTVWTFAEQAEYQQTNWLYLPLAAVVLFLCYRLNSRVALGLTLPGLALWAGITNAVYYESAAALFYSFALTAMAGFFFYALGNLVALKNWYPRMKISYHLAGLIIFLGSLFFLSFRFPYNWENLKLLPFFLAAFILAALGALGSGAIAVAAGKTDKKRFREGALVMVVSVVLLLLGLTAAFWGQRPLIAVENIFFFLAIIAVIVMGYANREPVLVNVGLVFFVFDVIARYFDFFWAMMDRSIFFMVGGLLLLVGGTLLERYRRKMVREMQVNNYAA